MQRHTHELVIGQSTVRKRFVSWDDGEADREWICLSLLAEHAPGIAPRPLARGEEDGRPFVVMERVPGDSLGPDAMRPEQIDALGRTLGSVYRVPVAAAAAVGLPERRFGPTVLRGRLRDSLERAPRQVETDDPALVEFALREALAHVVDSGTLLSPRLTCIGIADLNPANVLWDGLTCRLVDFEDGGLTEPAFELADHVEHIASRLAGTYPPGELCDAVGLSAADRARFERYRVLWASFWLLMLLPGAGAHSRNPPGTLEDQAEHLLSLIAQ